ncbi:MAG TPA: putative toxin-antitoxin system toxin component, PIN family [Tepidiformaceae bacterium]|nr:putative toxin-antitoxin system toxin component, PIN family [Tepidiformaceae bacterium]HMO96168.1 putative toxin-antitoxin system toxin component, PIN family [Tepidiformaceae bacterium]
MPLRVVADTTYLIKALLWSGPAALSYDACRRGVAQLVTSQEILRELAQVLARPKFGPRLLGPVETYVDDALHIAEVVSARADGVPVGLRDPNDASVIYTALAGQADLIVSDDSDLLVLKDVAGIAIVRPSDLLHTLGIAHER